MSACAQCFSYKGYVVGICCYRRRCPYNTQLDEESLQVLVKFCHDFQNSVCRRPNCKYIHASREDEYLFFKDGIVPPAMMDRCAVAPLYGFGRNPRVQYMGPYQHFNSRMAPNWAPAMGAAMMPPPPRPPPPPPPSPPVMNRPLLHRAPGPVYYARAPFNMYASPRLESIPTSEPLHIDIPLSFAYDYNPMTAVNGPLICTVDQLQYQSFRNFELPMAMQHQQPAYFHWNFYHNEAPR